MTIMTMIQKSHYRNGFSHYTAIRPIHGENSYKRVYVCICVFVCECLCFGVCVCACVCVCISTEAPSWRLAIGHVSVTMEFLINLS